MPGAQVALKLLETGKCDVNLQSNRGFTPLMVAAWKGEIDVVMELIKLEAKFYITDTGGGARILRPPLVIWSILLLSGAGAMRGA